MFVLPFYNKRMYVCTKHYIRLIMYNKIHMFCSSFQKTLREHVAMTDLCCYVSHNTTLWRTNRQTELLCQWSALH